MIQNPFQSKDGYQGVNWNQLESNKIYVFELIQPLKAIAFQYRKQEAGYLPVCAECIESIEKGEWTWVIKGGFCIVSFPIITLETAWMSISPIQRKQISDEDNLKVAFRKKSKQSIVFESVERKQPTQEHIDFANKNYIQPKPYKVETEEY